MTKPSYIKLLSRLRFRQVFRSKNWNGLSGILFSIVYFWLLELVLFFSLKAEMKGETVTAPLLGAGLVVLGFLVTDFILKLIFVRDNTVMDPFLKTRPIPQESWDRFLTLSQFWKPSNLQIPLILLPACFLFVRFSWGLILFLSAYLLSVFGGFLIMLLKHRGNYETEKAVSPHAVRSVRQGNGNYVFGLQSRSFLRSKRMKTGLIYLGVIFLLQYIAQGKSGQESFSNLFLFYFICICSLTFSQYGMGIEACYFSGIWTKPLAFRRILMDKYLFSTLMSGIAVLISLPFCLWLHTPVYVPLAYGLFSAGLGALLLMLNPFKCVPFDLFGKTFFNYQGSSGTFKASTVLGVLIVMGLGMALPFLFSEWIAYLILSILGIVGFAVARPYFRWVEKRFLQDKYKYMEKYLSL